jgi:hypothetical protein
MLIEYTDQSQYMRNPMLDGVMNYNPIEKEYSEVENMEVIPFDLCTIDRDTEEVYVERPNEEMKRYAIDEVSVDVDNNTVLIPKEKIISLDIFTPIGGANTAGHYIDTKGDEKNILQIEKVKQKQEIKMDEVKTWHILIVVVVVVLIYKFLKK